MRFAIMGAGGVGGYLGARLAADGNDVIFIDRGAHREAMMTEGLLIRSDEGDIHITEPQIFDGPAKAGFCDDVLFCVKPCDTEEAAALVRP